MTKQLIQNEQFTNIQRAQAGLTRLFAEATRTNNFYRVLKNDKPLGVLLPESMWKNLVEDIEALSSPPYIKRIAKARASSGTIDSTKLKKKLGL